MPTKSPDCLLMRCSTASHSPCPAFHVNVHTHCLQYLSQQHERAARTCCCASKDNKLTASGIDLIDGLRDGG